MIVDLRNTFANVDLLCCLCRKTPANGSLACNASVSTSFIYENFSSRTPKGISVKRTGCSRVKDISRDNI